MSVRSSDPLNDYMSYLILTYKYNTYLNASVIPSYHLDEYKSYLNTSARPSCHLDEYKSYLNTSARPSYII